MQHKGPIRELWAAIYGTDGQPIASLELTGGETDRSDSLENLHNALMSVICSCYLRTVVSHQFPLTHRSMETRFAL
jgi:hypothetical protein